MTVENGQDNEITEFITKTYDVAEQAIKNLKKNQMLAINELPYTFIDAYNKFRISIQWYYALKYEYQELDMIPYELFNYFYMSQLSCGEICDYEVMYESPEQVITLGHKNYVKRKEDFNRIASMYPYINISSFIDDIQTECMVHNIMLKAQFRKWSIEKLKKELRLEFPKLNGVLV